MDYEKIESYILTNEGSARFVKFFDDNTLKFHPYIHQILDLLCIERDRN